MATKTRIAISMIPIVLIAMIPIASAEKQFAHVVNPFGVSDCEVWELFDPLKYCGESVPVNQQIIKCWGCGISDALKLQKQLGVRILIP